MTTSALDPEVAPDYNPWADGLLKFKEEAEKNSNGRYVVEFIGIPVMPAMRNPFR